MRAVSQSETHFAIYFSDLNVLRFFFFYFGSWRCDVVRLELRLFHAGYDKRRRIVRGTLSAGCAQ